ncbi:tryptophan synthase subunit alpha [Methanosarcina sp. Mfa9]|uniref:tryptophan synthase subunit alpha n=1 Tax=Methanosarcina sp. Mfa9 TaxID=3439063 RepID=UPI003F8290F9
MTARTGKPGISEKFAELKARGEGALVSYVMAGDPSPEATREIVAALARGGTDIIELGLPFSDPVADGPTIQAAGQRALAAGMDTERFFELVEELGSEISGIPFVCMTYYNLVFRYGIEKFVAGSAKAGISGLIIPDLPVEEASELRESCERHGLDLIFLIAPTTTGERVRKVLERSSGFVYLVSRLGVTGTSSEVSGATKELLARVETDIPKAVGFGVSNGNQAAEIRKAGADGVIVGSAFVKIIESGNNVNERLETLARELKNGILEADKSE